MSDPDSLRVAADLCDDHGFSEAAEVLRREAGRPTKFAVSRTSSWDEKPCDEAYQEEVFDTDLRTCGSPEEFDARGIDRGRPWLSHGTNHRIIDGMIARDIGTRNQWFVNVDDIWAFQQKYGRLIIEPERVSGEWFPSIEIYDGWRE